MEINISYLKKDNTWHTLVTEPENYFDMDYCDLTAIDNEQIDEESAPKYDHAIEYIDEAIQPFVIATELNVNNKKTGILRKITSSYWHNQTQIFIERKDFLNEEIIYHEIILDIETKDSTSIKNTIIRIVYENSIPKPVCHRIYTEFDNGTDEEQGLDVWK